MLSFFIYFQIINNEYNNNLDLSLNSFLNSCSYIPIILLLEFDDNYEDEEDFTF